jgi:hypothetical protein
MPPPTTGRSPAPPRSDPPPRERVPALVVRADAATLLPGLPTSCVDAVVTDPPWNLGRPYGSTPDRMPEDEYVRWLNDVLRQCARVSRGPVVACLGSHNAPRVDRLLDRTGLRVAGWLSWHREPGQPEAVVLAAPPGWAPPARRLDAARRVLARTPELRCRWSVGLELEERWCRTATRRLRGGPSGGQRSRTGRASIGVRNST